MRVMVFGEQLEPALAEALAREGYEVDPVQAATNQGQGPVAELAAGMRSAEAALEADPPAVALVAGDGDGALAVALTAVKLGVPCAWIEPSDAGEGAGLLGQVADLTLDATADAAQSARAVAGIAVPTLAGS